MLIFSYLNVLSRFNRIVLKYPYSMKRTITVFMLCACISVMAQTSNGLVYYLPFYDGNTGTLQDQGPLSLGNPMNYNGIEYVLGLKDQAADFDGISDYFQLNTSGSLANVGTVVMWFKPAQNITSSINSRQYLFDDDYNLFFDHYYYPGQLILDAWGNHTLTSGIDNWESNKWYMVAFTVDPTEGTKLYVDGILVTSNSLADNTFSARYGYIGARGTYSDEFSGQIDEFRIYNRALSETEVLSLYHDIVGVPVSSSPWIEENGTLSYDSGNVLIGKKLGIGVDSVTQVLQLKSDDPRIEMERTGSNKWQARIDNNGKFVIQDATNITEPIKIEAGSPTDAIHIKNNGNIGVGNPAPAHMLDVAGSVNANALLINGQPVNADNPWILNTSNVYTTTGNVGLGTSNPNHQLSLPGGGANISLGDNIFINGEGSTGRISNNAFRNGASWNIPDNTSYSTTIEMRDNGVIDFYGTTTAGNPTWNKMFGIDAPNNVSYFPSCNVGIGTSSPQSKLAVNGVITTKEVNVTIDGWSDFVFDDDYSLMSLQKLKHFIRQNNHLPDIPSSEDVAKNGINLGEMDAKLLQKIEELTLYLIEIQKENAELRRRVEKLENK